jgi:hypothetical protein
MIRFFFDVKASGSIDHDYKGQFLRTIQDAVQMAELMALDLSFKSMNTSALPEVQIRDARGNLLASVPVRVMDAVAA